MANVVALHVEVAEAPKAEPPPLPTFDIRTEENPEVMQRRLEDLKLDIKALQPESKWLYVQKHVETVQKDPLRKPAEWGNVPLMNIPRVIAAISSPPPLLKMSVTVPHLGQTNPLMFSTTPSTGMLNWRQNVMDLRTSAVATSWGVVTITAPSTGAAS